MLYYAKHWVILARQNVIEVRQCCVYAWGILARSLLKSPFEAQPFFVQVILARYINYTAREEYIQRLNIIIINIHQPCRKFNILSLSCRYTIKKITLINAVTSQMEYHFPLSEEKTERDEHIMVPLCHNYMLSHLITTRPFSHIYCKTPQKVKWRQYLGDFSGLQFECLHKQTATTWQFKHSGVVTTLHQLPCLYSTTLLL